MSYEIFTDTSANIPTDLAKKKGIRIVPFTFTCDGKDYICDDTADFDAKDYYDKIRNGAIFKTTQINPQKFCDYFSRDLKEGKDIIFVSLSSGVSGSYNSAVMAAEILKEEYPDRQIEIIDSLGASLGQGIPVLKATEMKENGIDLTENTAKVKEIIKRMYQVFTVDNLMYLKRNGRLSGASAIVGTMLQIKPILKGNPEGKIVNFEKERGRKKAIERLAEKFEKLAVNPKEQLIGISEADCKEDAEYLVKLLKRTVSAKNILVVPHEPATGSHVGPGMLGLYFMGDENIREK